MAFQCPQPLAPECTDLGLPKTRRCRASHVPTSKERKQQGFRASSQPPRISRPPPLSQHTPLPTPQKRHQPYPDKGARGQKRRTCCTVAVTVRTVLITERGPFLSVLPVHPWASRDHASRVDLKTSAVGGVKRPSDGENVPIIDVFVRHVASVQHRNGVRIFIQRQGVRCTKQPHQGGGARTRA